MSRRAPERTPAEQQEHERRQALTRLDVAAMRAWAARYAVGLLGDDETVLISMHETRVLDGALPAKCRRESVAWLKQCFPASAVLAQLERFPREFRRRTHA